MVEAAPDRGQLNLTAQLQEITTRRGPHNEHVLPFRALVVLPAELLALPIPTISWALEEVPVCPFVSGKNTVGDPHPQFLL